MIPEHLVYHCPWLDGWNWQECQERKFMQAGALWKTRRPCQMYRLWSTFGQQLPENIPLFIDGSHSLPCSREFR